MCGCKIPFPCINNTLEQLLFLSKKLSVYEDVPFMLLIVFHLLRLPYLLQDRLCGLVVRVLGYRSGGPGSIPGTTRKKKSSVSGTRSTQPREYN
jgi:hypothetical protein